MIGIIMAGGKGTRMDLDNEKLLLEYKKPLILHVVDSLKSLNYFSKILAVTSFKNSPKTKKLLEENNVETFDTLGLGYAKDLNSVLQTINDDVLVTSGDMPLLDAEILQKIVDSYDPRNIWTSIVVTNQFLTSLGFESDYFTTVQNKVCSYTGISLINSKKINSFEKFDEHHVIINDKRIAFNLNTKQDYDLLCAT